MISFTDFGYCHGRDYMLRPCCSVYCHKRTHKHTPCSHCQPGGWRDIQVMEAQRHQGIHLCCRKCSAHSLPSTNTRSVGGGERSTTTGSVILIILQMLPCRARSLDVLLGTAEGWNGKKKRRAEKCLYFICQGWVSQGFPQFHCQI